MSPNPNYRTVPRPILVAALIACWGCSSGSSTGNEHPDDASTSTGGSGVAGASGSGGATGVGGGSGVGGTVGTGGGATNTGGSKGSGGVATTGGAGGNGGSVGSTGGITGSGGRPQTGGTTSTKAGGTTGKGGAGGGTGGAPTTGGAGGHGTGGSTPRLDAGSDVRPGDGSPSTGTDATYPIATGTPKVYLAGDSTVQTYSASQAPQQGWGQRIAEFFTKDVTFVNKSIGGRSSKSFIDEGRLTEILGLLKEGDYLFAQWGINDRYQSDEARYTNPATTFRTYLKQYIDGARGKKAIPVLVTPTPRLDYSGGVFHNGFTDYCKAIKEVGLETNTPVIDLQTMGLAYYTKIGYDAVVEKIAMPGPDVLHFRDTGAYQMARLVAQGTKDIDVPISELVIESKLAE